MVFDNSSSDMGLAALLMFLIIVIIVAIPVLAIGLFARNVAKKGKTSSPKQDNISKKLFVIISISSLVFLAVYFTNTQTGGGLSICYLIALNFFVYKMNRKWAIRTAILAAITLSVFAFNHYPQYSGRDCSDYYDLTECRTPRFSLKNSS